MFSSSKTFFNALIALIFMTMLYSCKNHKNRHSSHDNSGNRELTKYEKQLGIALPTDIDKEYIKAIIPWLGAPYKYGGTTVNGTDCSGFVYSIYSQVFGIKLERTSAAMHEKAKSIKLNQLKEGDLLFFRIDSKKVSHVGMHITADYFIHASTKKGVVVSSIAEPYYKQHFISSGTYR